jgi:hypothetical protein
MDIRGRIRETWGDGLKKLEEVKVIKPVFTPFSTPSKVLTCFQAGLHQGGAAGGNGTEMPWSRDLEIDAAECILSFEDLLCAMRFSAHRNATCHQSLRQKLKDKEGYRSHGSHRRRRSGHWVMFPATDYQASHQIFL